MTDNEKYYLNELTRKDCNKLLENRDKNFTDFLQKIGESNIVFSAINPDPQTCFWQLKVVYSELYNEDNLNAFLNRAFCTCDFINQDQEWFFDEETGCRYFIVRYLGVNESNIVSQLLKIKDHLLTIEECGKIEYITNY